MHRDELFLARMSLDPILVAERPGEILVEEGRGTDDLPGRFSRLADATDITFKIRYNDAVAMTGGQMTEGALGPDRIARELSGRGRERIGVVFDRKEEVLREGVLRASAGTNATSSPA